jgi:Secretion system C-terminal sorting domain
LYGTEVSTCALSNITPPFSINGNMANFSVASGASLTLTNTSCPAGSTPKSYNSTTLGEVSSPITNFTTNTTYHSKCFLNASCISLKSADITVSINTITCPLNIVSFTRNIPTDPNCRTYNLTVKANVAISAANPQTMKMTVIPGNGFDPSASTINVVSLNGNANYNSWVDNGAAHSWTINSLGTNVNAALSLKFCWVQPPYPNMVATLFGCNVNQTVLPVGAARLSSDRNETESNLFTIYPNPTNDKLTVEYSLTKDSEIGFGIVDMTGKTLQNRTIDGKAGTHSFVMDVSKIIEGSYILRGIADDKSQAKKFVIIR